VVNVDDNFHRSFFGIVSGLAIRTQIRYLAGVIYPFDRSREPDSLEAINLCFLRDLWL
jgi:hypothetical protein